MKKKYSVSFKDRKEWLAYTKRIGELYDKDADLVKNRNIISKLNKLDLHGYSLNNANKATKEFVIKSFLEGEKKILVITGKGTRSKAIENPYLSAKMNILKYSVPENLKKDEDLQDKIYKIMEADIKDGGEGAFYIFLKKKKNL